MQVKTCQLCGKHAPITYTCQQCKREVCEGCFRHIAGVCSHCYSLLEKETPPFVFPMKLFLLGFALIIIGTILLVAFSILQGGAQPSFGAVFIIGFIPIILGAGPHATFAVLLAIILTILAMIFFFLLRK